MWPTGKADPTPRPAHAPKPTHWSCADDAEWSLDNQPEKNCDWVGGVTWRCDSVGWDGRDGWEACALSCDSCPDYYVDDNRDGLINYQEFTKVLTAEDIMHIPPPKSVNSSQLWGDGR